MMKPLYKLFSGLRDMYLSGKAIFIFMLIGIFASNIVLIYCYSTNVASMRNTVGTGYYSVPNANGLSAAEIGALDFGSFDDDVVHRDILFQPRPDANRAEGYEYPAIITHDGERIEFTAVTVRDGTRYMPLSISAYPGNEAKLVPEYGKGDLVDDPDGIIIPYNELTKDLAYDDETKSYGTAVIDGNSYRIVGATAWAGRVTVSWEAFSEFGYTATYLELGTSRTFSHSENTLFCEILESKLGKNSDPDYYLDHPYHVYEALAEQRVPYLALFFLLYLVSLVTLVFYTNYFTERQQRRNAICHVCGASKSALASTLLFGIIFVSVMCFFAAFAVYSLLSAFTGISIFGGVIYGAVDIVYMLVSAVAAPFILTVPAVRKIYRLSAAELCRASS